MAEQEIQSDPKEKPPLKSPPVLLERTQSIIGQIEAELHGPLITYWNSTNGSICSNDVVGMYGILKSIGKVRHLRSIHQV